MIVDAHVHIFDTLRGHTASGAVVPLAYGRARLGSGATLRFLPPLCRETSHTVEMLLEHMDWAGVERAVLLQGPLYGDMNAYIHAAVKRWPDRFTGAGLMDPWLPSAPEAMRYLLEDLGFRHLKLELTEDAGLCGIHPDLDLASERLFWFWQAADSAGLTLTLDLGAPGSRSYQTVALARLMDAHPHVRWVIAHLCQPSPAVAASPERDAEWLTQVSLALRPNVWLDLAALPHCYRAEGYPYPGAAAAVRRAAALVGPERLLWGTDLPGMLTLLTYGQLVELGRVWAGADAAAIMGVNALAVYA